MTEPHDPLESRLRHALGAAGRLGEPGGPPRPGGAALGAARTRVLADLRHRRLRRMQLAGGGGALVLAAAIAVPLAVAIGRTPAGRGAGSTGVARSPGATAARPPGSGGVAAVAPDAGATAAGAGMPTTHPAATGQCAVNGAPAVACGVVVSPTRYASLPVMPPSGAHASVPSSLSAAAGSTLRVTLPPAPPGTRWATPAVTDTTPAPPGRTPVLSVTGGHAAGSAGTFGVSTRHAGSAVLHVSAVADRCAGSARCPSASEWSLHVTVTG